MIDYQNITDNEIKRIITEAADPKAQVKILRDLTGKSSVYIKKAAGLPVYEKDKKADIVRGWSPEDIQFVRDNPDMPSAALSEHLKKSVGSIWNMRSKLGIKSKPRWDEKKTKELIRLLKADRSPRAIAMLLGKSLSSVKSKIYELRKAGLVD